MSLSPGHQVHMHAKGGEGTMVHDVHASVCVLWIGRGEFSLPVKLSIRRKTDGMASTTKRARFGFVLSFPETQSS